VMIYEMVTGHAPFGGPDLPALMHAISGDDHLPPSRIDTRLPRMLDLILAKALAKKVDDRYQDARELAADLRACREQLPPVPVTPVQEQTMKLERGATGVNTAGDATQKLGADGTLKLPADGTVKLDADGFAITVPLSEAAHTDPAMISTVPLDQMETVKASPSSPPARAAAKANDPAARYAVSPHFDASATLMKLKRPAAPDATVPGNPAAHEATLAGTTRRLRKSPERLFIASAIVLAVVAAVLIAVL